MYDITIIGGGVIGALTARELTRYKLKICILEKNSDVAMGASAANSGIVHSGYDAPENSLKAYFNVMGNQMMEQTAKQLGVKYKNNGSLVLAFNKNDLQTINKLCERGIKNGVQELKVINKEELLKMEPNINDNVEGALFAKTGGIVCPYELAIAACGNAMDNGAHLKLNFNVNNIIQNKDGFEIISKTGENVQTKIVINCAGIYSDKIANMIGDYSFKIGARKGEYILLDKESGNLVNHTLFLCPDDNGKGVLLTNTVDGNILLGPTSVEIEDKEDNTTSAAGYETIIEKTKKTIKNIPLYNTITSFTGVRAYSDRHDFIIEESKMNNDFINVAGIESPGLTSSPAIARYVTALVVKKFKTALINESYNGWRKSDSYFKNLSNEEKNEIIKKDKTYGKIICRCEEVTLGEINFAIKRNPKPLTLDAVKRRTRAGMGRCQSGFCQPYLMEIINKELNIPYEDITKFGGNSTIITGRTK